MQRIDPSWSAYAGLDGDSLAARSGGLKINLLAAPIIAPREAVGYWDVGTEDTPRVAEVALALMGRKAWDADPRSSDPTWACHDFGGQVVAVQLTV